MSINQYCPDLTQPHRWSHLNQLYYAGQETLPGGPDLNNQEDDGCGAAEEIPKERLFEKPLTPSDVGKLNRLVIPKQHAEKHFPLGGGGREAGENGLLLGFEDEAGKSWRFRYSYWNSSQSYVLTKGWSRFVKEKRLDAGDVVVFARHRVDAGRLFIGWRRRSDGDGGDSQSSAAAGSGGGRWNRVLYPAPNTCPGQYVPSGPSSVAYQPESIHAGTIVPQTTSSGNSKRLRLFGVNLDCHLEVAEDAGPSTQVGLPMSGPGQAHQHHHPSPYLYHHHSGYHYPNDMDMSFSGSADVYRQG